MATLGSPLLLTESEAPPPQLSAVLGPIEHQQLREVVLFGGTHAIAQVVEDEIAGIVQGTEQ
jgi:hypothetical protein